jgi:hypothetical protein
MFRSIVLSLGMVAAFVAGHEGHDDDHSSAVVYTTVMVMDGMTTTMEMTMEATASGDLSATAAAASTTASPGLAHQTGVPAQLYASVHLYLHDWYCYRSACWALTMSSSPHRGCMTATHH